MQNKSEFALKFEKSSEQILNRFGQQLLLIGCLLTPLKLSLTYILFGPVIALWIFSNLTILTKKFSEYLWFTGPWTCLVLSFCISSLFGMHPLRSINAMYSFVFYPVIIFALADRFKAEKALLPLCALISGQTIAAIHTIVESSSSQKIPRFFLGEVTEAGQLSLCLPLACGLAITAHRYSGLKLNRISFIKNVALLCLLAFVLTYLPIALAGSVLLWWQSIILVLLILAAVFAGSALWQSNAAVELPNKIKFLLPRIKSVVIPILIAAVILNLKRGPWAGCMVAILMLMFLYSRTLSLIFIVCSAITILSLTPVQNRLLESSRDFFIAGGRSDIWQVGLEIAERFPLGTGYRSSKSLHQYSVQIPKELTHFHNNLINILVEGGPLTLILFIIWAWSVFKFCFEKTKNHKLNPLFKASACALVSWMIVGLFEYNLGDSEVLFVLYIMLGVIAGAKKSSSSDQF